jgi:predicted aconitase with swiveling domain
MTNVIVEGSLTPCVYLARGEKRTLVLTESVQRRIKRGFYAVLKQWEPGEVPPPEAGLVTPGVEETVDPDPEPVVVTPEPEIMVVEPEPEVTPEVVDSLGTLDPETNLVVDPETEEVVATVDPETNEVTDPEGEVLGVLNAETGEIVDPSGEVVGVVETGEVEE